MMREAYGPSVLKYHPLIYSQENNYTTPYPSKFKSIKSMDQYIFLTSKLPSNDLQIYCRGSHSKIGKHTN
jgi:hypothetical protein